MVRYPCGDTQNTNQTGKLAQRATGLAANHQNVSIKDSSAQSQSTPDAVTGKPHIHNQGNNHERHHT